MQQTAKIFATGRSQVVRLPLEFRFDVSEVFIRHDPATGDVVLSRKPTDWQGLLDAVAHNTDEDLLIERRLVTSPSARRELRLSSIFEMGLTCVRNYGAEVSGQVDLAKLDFGLRVLKINTSNMKEVFYTPDAVSQDLLSQVLLDWGVDLALPITQETIAGKAVFFVDGNALAACFEEGVSEEFVKLQAKRELLRVVFRDAGFANDSVKINGEKIFKLMSSDIEVKCI